MTATAADHAPATASGSHPGDAADGGPGLRAGALRNRARRRRRERQPSAGRRRRRGRSRPRRPHSPTHSWTDSPGGSYGNNLSTSLTSAPLDLSAAVGVELSFWHRYATEAGYDYCHVEVSADNGATWTEIATYDGTNTTWTRQTFTRARARRRDPGAGALPADDGREHRRRRLVRGRHPDARGDSAGARRCPSSTASKPPTCPAGRASRRSGRARQRGAASILSFSPAE